MDMRFHWLRDRETLKQLRIHWRAGKLNLGDYQTKHHSAKHHRDERHVLLTPVEEVIELRKRLQNLEKQNPEEHKRFAGRVTQGKLLEPYW